MCGRETTKEKGSCLSCTNIIGNLHTYTWMSHIHLNLHTSSYKEMQRLLNNDLVSLYPRNTDTLLHVRIWTRSRQYVPADFVDSQLSHTRVVHASSTTSSQPKCTLFSINAHYSYHVITCYCARDPRTLTNYVKRLGCTKGQACKRLFYRGCRIRTSWKGFKRGWAVHRLCIYIILWAVQWPCGLSS